MTPELTFTDGRVDSGQGEQLAQAMRDEIAVIYDGLDLDGDTMPKAGQAELARRTAPFSSAGSTASRSAAGA